MEADGARTDSEREGGRERGRAGRREGGREGGREEVKAAFLHLGNQIKRKGGKRVGKGLSQSLSRSRTVIERGREGGRVTIG